MNIEPHIEDCPRNIPSRTAWVICQFCMLDVVNDIIAIS